MTQAKNEELIVRLREEATHDLHHETIALLLKAAQVLAAQQDHEPENEPFVSLASVQEPVAWVPCLYPGHYITLTKPPESWKMIPLYTTPPAAQRQWVGLTDEQGGTHETS
jgi:hypothetical protein